MSQMGVYTTREGMVLAKAFRYLQPDGEVGGSKKPDPKWLNRGDHILDYPTHKDDAVCEEPICKEHAERRAGRL